MREKKSERKILFICQSINSDLRHLYNIKKRINLRNVTFADEMGDRLLFLPQTNRLSALFRFVNWSRMAKNIRGIIFLKVTDVIFDDSSPFYLIYGLILKFFKINIIYTLHDQIAHEGRGAWLMSLYIALVSRFLANEIVIFGSPRINTSARIHQLCLGGYLGEAFGQVVEPEKGCLKILMFGRIKQYKGFEHLAEIAKLTAHLPVQYRVVGAGESKLLDIVSNLPNVVVENRYIEEAEIPAIFNSTHLNILPYNSGTQSGVALLSASFGVPSLAFDVGDLKAYLERGIGRSVSAFDYKQMASEIAEAASVDDWREIRRQTRSAYDANFSSRAFNENYREMCSSIISHGGNT